MKKKSLPLIAFLQALGLTVYCSLVAVIFWKGNTWFGPQNNLIGPTMVLVLLVVSVLICALIAFGYPVFLFWQKKETNRALKLVAYTAGWLVLFVLIFILVILLT
ncbi:MAG: hypothetical protein P8Y17_00910 [Patescibacteria group bacterium]